MCPALGSRGRVLTMDLVRRDLAGGGYPSYSHIQKIRAAGHVPLLKLHGSVSWSVRDSELVKYHDCRLAIRGDAAIVAPIVGKTVPTYLQPTWDTAKTHLSRARTWIVIGYSLPRYDQSGPVAPLGGHCAEHDYSRL